jgi:hypothetical protein
MDTPIIEFVSNSTVNQHYTVAWAAIYIAVDWVYVNSIEYWNVLKDKKLSIS